MNHGSIYKENDMVRDTGAKVMEEQSDELLQGKTMKIYWFLLTHGESGIREIKRHLNISSPSTVSYHMNKLVDAGLVTKSTTDKYIVEETVRTGIFGLYIKIGTRMIPRMLFYISFFTIGCFLYLLVMFNRGSLVIHTEDFLFLLFVIGGAIFFSYEAYRIWRMKPL
ncbi:MAG: ArsR family transcriptional regulator [Candidatus Hodarchaeota archaeon]